MGYDLSSETSEIWRQVNAIMKNDLSEISYKTWFSNIQLTSIGSDSIILTTISEFNKSILESRYHDLISKAFYTVTSYQYYIEIKAVVEKSADIYSDSDVYKFRGKSLLPEYTFGNFVIGNCNRMAVKAFKEIAGGSSRFNPLYIYGSVGVGKTHLLHAVGNDIQSRNNSSAIMYLNVDDFIHRLINCIKDDRMTDFYHEFAAIDVFILDNLQSIEGKMRTQEELCRVINYILREGRQVILAANKAPESISYLSENFSSHFELGAVICMEEPDECVKREIIKQHIREKEFALSDEEIENLAAAQYRGVRDLINSINRIYAFQELCGED